MSKPAYQMRWDGDHLVPIPAWRTALDRELVIGQEYVVTVDEPRGEASHGHYFAALKEAWQNLPEAAIRGWPTPEHFRKHLLIKVGYSDQRSIVCSSAAEAMRLAAFIRPLDEYGVVTVEGATVTQWTAKSQSMRAMGKQAFLDSKWKVLEEAAHMIGVPVESLRKESAL